MVFSRISYFPVFMLGFLGCVATFGLVSVAIYMRVPVDPTLVLTTWCIMVGVYGINRFTDIEDLVNDPAKRQFFRDNKYLVTIPIGLLVASVLMLFFADKLTVFHVFAIAVGVLYSVKAVPLSRRSGSLYLARLKDLTFFKSTSVSLILGTSFFWVNWAVYPQYVGSAVEIILLMVSCMLVVFVNTNFCDIRDVSGDRIAGVATIPARFGVGSTVIHAMLLPTSAWLLTVASLAFSGVVKPPLLIFFAINAVFPLTYLWGHFSMKIPPRAVAIVADSSLVVFGIGLLVLRFARLA